MWFFWLYPWKTLFAMQHITILNDQHAFYERENIQKRKPLKDANDFQYVWFINFKSTAPNTLFDTNISASTANCIICNTWINIIQRFLCFSFGFLGSNIFSLDIFICRSFLFKITQTEWQEICNFGNVLLHRRSFDFKWIFKPSTLNLNFCCICQCWFVGAFLFGQNVDPFQFSCIQGISSSLMFNFTIVNVQTTPNQSHIYSNQDARI